MKAALFSFTLALGVPGFLGAQDLTALEAPELAEFSRFGHAVSLAENMACIAAPYHTVGDQPEQGVIHLFEQSGDWQHSVVIAAPDGKQYDKFGYSVAMHESVLAVGAPGNGAGAVYIFERQNGQWILTSTIRPYLESGQVISEMEFGFSLALTDKYLFISAPFWGRTYAEEEASVFIYTREQDGWTYRQRISNPDGNHASQFGNVIAAHGERLIVGAPQADGGAPTSGAAYLFERSKGVFHAVHTFIYPESFSYERYGTSVDIDGEQVIIGSIMHVFDPAEGPKGTAHVYVHAVNTWFHTGMLSSAFSERNDFYAQRVGILGDIAVVSAVRAHHSGQQSPGSIHVFKQENGFWSEKYRLIPGEQDAQSHMYFGGAFSLHRKALLIGAHLEDNLDEDSGNAYIHDLDALVDTDENPNISGYALYEAVPNPFQDNTTLTFDLPVGENLRIEAFDLHGRMVERIAHGYYPAGDGHQVIWNASRAPSGLYYIQLHTGRQIATIKVIHIQ